MADSVQKLLFVIGTRPEAIKLAPLVLAARAQPQRFQVSVVRTSQHREMLDQMLALFDIQADVDLDIMQPGQDLVHITSAGLRGLYDAMGQIRPDCVVVQGDTTTTFVGALAAFYRQIPVAHVEAGLRTGKRYLPFPEEINRSLTGRLTSLHFAPTQRARDNLLWEGIDAGNIHVTGNTAIDALLWTLCRQGIDPAQGAAGERPLLLVTAHRRENQGAEMVHICHALLTLLERHPRLEVLFPMHLSPAVRNGVIPLLGGHARVQLVEPLDYAEFVLAMHRATLILTDSGGVQEEAPSLGKPVLVMRSETERPEAVEAGAAILVGTDPARIVREVSHLLDDPQAYRQISQVRNPFGDGTAAQQILQVLATSGGCHHV